MPTRIRQIEDGQRIILRVEGSLTLEDAALLENICRDLQKRADEARIVFDLADLSFLDSESASVLHRLKEEYDVTLEGVHQFIQQAIEMAERSK